MSVTRWTRIDAVFAGALTLPLEERESFLTRACRGDAEFRAEVDALLAAADASEGYFEEGISSSLLRELGLLEDHALPPGSPVGAYRVVRMLGEGGMGSVYLAERADGQFEQRVAIKRVHPEWVRGGRMVERFLRERQILARLDHPSIARLLDGGMTEDGVPYLVMEHVEGVRIDEYCSSKGLGTRERIELIREVGRAVQYAHRNLVIHRDLKPSNILITTDGAPKLLDFGIALMVEEDASDLTVTRTSLMTPAYAAPEQIRGEGVTTATDVYALGVLLYELLVGTRPGEAPDTGALRRAAPGDVDRICLMALREEPERRYPSAEAFVEDLGRHLEARPVRARPDTLVYRTRKFLERNRVPVLAAGLVALSLVGGMTATLKQSAVARAEATKAREVSTFVLGLFEESDPALATTDETTLRDILDRGATRIATELSGQPALQAEMYSLIGPIHARMGHHEDARAMLTRAIELQSELAGSGSRPHAAATLELARLEARAGNLERADQLFRESRALFVALEGDESADVARVERNRAEVSYRSGRYGEADSLYQTARRTLEATGAPPAELVRLDLGHLQVLHTLSDPERVERMHARILANREHLESARSTVLADGMLRMGQEALYGGDPERAHPLIEGALELRTQVHGEVHADVASAMAELSAVHWAFGRTDEAIRTRTRAVEILRETLGPDHPDYAMRLGSLAVLLGRDGQLEAADSVFAETERIQTAAFGDAHLHVAATRRNRGRTLAQMGRFEEAIASLEAGLRSWELSMGTQGSFVDETRLDVAATQARLGAQLLDRALRAEAEELLLAAHQTLAALVDPANTEDVHVAVLVQTRERLARLYESLGRSDEAARFAGLPR